MKKRLLLTMCLYDMIPAPCRKGLGGSSTLLEGVWGSSTLPEGVGGGGKGFQHPAGGGWGVPAPCRRGLGGSSTLLEGVWGFQHPAGRGLEEGGRGSSTVSEGVGGSSTLSEGVGRFQRPAGRHEGFDISFPTHQILTIELAHRTVCRLEV